MVPILLEKLKIIVVLLTMDIIYLVIYLIFDTKMTILKFSDIHL